MRRRLVLLSTLASAALVASLTLTMCGTSGRDMRTPIPNAASPTRSSNPTIAPSTEPTTEDLSTAPGGTELVPGGTGDVAIPAGRFAALSSAFPAGGPIPPEFSCGGPSLPIAWRNVPAGTSELALSVTDNDADGFVHWLVTGIPATDASITKGEVPPGGFERNNSLGKPGWYGPCPPEQTQHTYVFTVYVLPQPANLAADVPPKDAVAQLHTLAHGSAVFTGTFAR